MHYVTLKARTIDTIADLSEPERHVMQKLIAWERLGIPTVEFKRKTDDALQKGWDGRGPVRASVALRDVCEDLAARLAVAAGERPGPGWLKAQAWPGRYGGGGLRLAEETGPETIAEVIDAADRPCGVLRLPKDLSLAEAAGQLRSGGLLTGALRAMGLRIR